MDFAWNPIMDVALNVIGYMAAGALALVVHRIFKDRSVGQVRIANASFEIGPQTEPDMAGTQRRPNRPRFVKLGEPPADPVSHRRVTIDRAGPQPSQTLKRTEIIRLAKRMLDSGAGEKRIQQVLPVSKAELVLLNNGKSR